MLDGAEGSRQSVARVARDDGVNLDMRQVPRCQAAECRVQSFRLAWLGDLDFGSR